MNAHTTTAIALVLSLITPFLAYVGYRIGRAIERDAHTLPGMRP